MKKQEYIEYLGEVIKILLSDMNEHTVELSLVNIAAEMCRCKPEEVVRFHKVVKELLELRGNLKKLHRLLPKDSRGRINLSELKRVESLNRELDEYLRIGEEIEKEKQNTDAGVQ